MVSEDQKASSDAPEPWSYDFLNKILKEWPDQAQRHEDLMRTYNQKFRKPENQEIPPIEQIDRCLSQDALVKAVDLQHVEVSICTFNILAQGIYERRCQKDGEEVSDRMRWPERRLRLLDCLRRSPKLDIVPDILAMQEVETATFSSFVEDGYQGVFLSKYPPERKREGQAIAVKKSSWEIVAQQGFHYAEPDFSHCLGESPTDGAWPQKALIVTLQHTVVREARIVIAVSHLGAEPRGELVGDVLRTLELRELHRRAKERAAELGGVPYFVCVDQNADRNEMPFQYASASGLISVQEEASPTHNMGLDPTDSKKSPLEHDFLYYDKKLLDHMRREDIVVETGRLELTVPTHLDGASDHTPVFASFKLPVSLWQR